MNFKKIGKWWNNNSIELVEIDETVYALGGWNGEKFISSWICTGEGYTEASEEEYTITPIYNDEDEPEVIAYEVIQN